VVKNTSLVFLCRPSAGPAAGTWHLVSINKGNLVTYLLAYLFKNTQSVTNNVIIIYPLAGIARSFRTHALQIQNDLKLNLFWEVAYIMNITADLTNFRI